MLSAVLNVKNDQLVVKTCLESIKWVDEIVVVLNDSTDGTEEIVKKYTKNIFKINGQDFAKVKNLGLEKTKGNWVLFIDADERVLMSLREEIKQLIEKNEKSAYAISRKNIIFGSKVSYGPYKHDWVIRLVKKSDSKGWIGKVHEHLEFSGQLGYSKNSLLHLTHRDIDQIVLKSLNWSKIDAKLRLEAGHPKMTGWRFLRIFITEIFNQGVKRRGFFAGSIGMMDCLLQVFSLYITYVRLWQLQQPKSLEQVYQGIDQKLVKDDFNF